MALKALNDALNKTPVFRAGTWLLLNVFVCAAMWRRRQTPAGAFVIGLCGSGAVYLLSFLAVGVSTDLRYAYFAVLAALAGAVVAAQGSEKDDLAVPQPAAA
jgi:hypothetical protein